MTPTTVRIAIIGAGPGGLACARVLQRHGVPVTVFDHDAGVRPRGGMLGLPVTTAQEALRAAGLHERFAALARPEGRELRLLDHTATVLFRHTPGPGASDRPAGTGPESDHPGATDRSWADEPGVHEPGADGPGAARSEIDRSDLRRLLLDSLAPGTVRWNSYLRTLHPLGDGRHRAEFDDGHSETFDLVVGADGTWSRVRPMLSDADPHYTGVTFVESGCEDAGTRHPDIARLVGGGGMWAESAGRALFARREGGGRIRVYAAFRGSQDWALDAGVRMADTDAVRAALLDRFAGWDERLLALLRANDGGFANRPLFALPVPHTWTHTPGLTLLGDAAHLMPPFTGRGADLALLDGADLARALAAHDDPDEAVRAYEAAMLSRAAAAAEAAARASADALAPDAPRASLHQLRAAFGAPQP
ncbi:NAD(P)/FAD-dependent oxidoreductase [Streptomyces angustmyceticus]|uniref:Flavin-dependent monooxygenase n=1 Tax=Streptomyces angustmyceticus TaxID=285578 RepID=A0A5J4LL63_9ACTN|nr:NAD(P)/FAD-dependent oxidoreductase [Streptomyces angustmyceticus]UAL70411.1 FAD-dependent monooxygenase [Streptomyces angustmyceticus]GES33244.1 monooxygenase [Streptomyces angustmyceticus]